MHASFGMLVFSLFIIGLTVYFVANHSDEGAWVYITILLLGMALAIKAEDGSSFATQLYKLGFPQQTGTFKATQGQGGQ